MYLADNKKEQDSLPSGFVLRYPLGVTKRRDLLGIGASVLHSLSHCAFHFWIFLFFLVSDKKKNLKIAEDEKDGYGVIVKGALN